MLLLKGTVNRLNISLKSKISISMRNRSEGWAYAKNSGHENESLAEALLVHDSEYQHSFVKRLGHEGTTIVRIDTGGINETNVESVLGGTTKTKTDIHILLSDGAQVNISLKKSWGGQVYLISIDHFIHGYETQFQTTIPDNVKRAIELFWGSANDVPEIVANYGFAKAYKTRKHRLTADTLRAYNPMLHNALLNWFKENVGNLSRFCFTMGLAADPREHADFVWYKNELGDEGEDFDYLIPTADLSQISGNNTDLVVYGNRSHGTTIQLPFGFVQWHSPTKVIPGCLQFHHKLESIINILK